MQTQQTVNEGLKRAYLITIPAGEIAAKIDAEIKKVAPQVRMPGFRPGKVPANLIRKMHGESLRREVVQRSITEAVQKLLTDKGLRPAVEPTKGERRSLVSHLPFVKDKDATVKPPGYDAAAPAAPAAAPAPAAEPVATPAEPQAAAASAEPTKRKGLLSRLPFVKGGDDK